MRLRGLGIALLALSTLSMGQAPRGNRVCVVLGGGAALGWAHVGVLKAFEERHIPVDCVAGTSAGGLVGGLYSIGMAPGEIESMLVSVPWDELFTGRPLYGDLPWRRKEDRRDFPFRYEFGLRGNELRLPGGLDPAHRIGLLLSRVSLVASPMGRGSALRNFDDLVLPFRCVAVDLNSGEERELKGGSLFQALRATMAIPVNFTPMLRNVATVDRDGNDVMQSEVLVDGGLLNNVPVDVAKRAFDPEFVFAVKLSGLQTPFYGQETLSEILTRSIGVAGDAQLDRKNSKPDILFTPNLAEFSGTDYARSEELVKRGYEETKRAFEAGYFGKLDAFRLSDADWEAYLAARKAKRAKLNNLPVPRSIRAVATRVVQDDRSGRRRPGEPWIKLVEEDAPDLANRLSRFLGMNLLDNAILVEFEQELNKIVGEGQYENLAYEMVVDGQGRQELLIRAKEKSYAPPFANFGADISTFDNNNTRLSMRGRVTIVNPWGFGSEARLDIGFGARNSIGYEFLRPLSGRKLFLAPRAFYSRGTESIFNSSSELVNYRSEVYGIGVDFLAPIGRDGEVRFGYEFGRRNNTVAVGQPSINVGSGVLNQFRFRYRYDKQDGDYFPTKGLRTDSDIRWVLEAPGARRQFLQAAVRFSDFVKISRSTSVFGIFEGGSTFGVNAPPLEQFSLGGPFRMGAYGLGQLRADNYGYLAFGGLRGLAKLPDVIGGRTYLALWQELAFVGPARSGLKLRTSTNGGFLVETILGPVFLGGSFGDGGQRTLYLTLGRGF